MNPVYDAILENLKYIQIDFEPTLQSFKKDTKQTSDSKEVSVMSFLKRFFPITYQIQKGPIYDITSVSNEIDCVILAPNHPQLGSEKRNIILSEGVYAAVEVKPDIANKKELDRGLGQIKSVKNLKRDIKIVGNITNPSNTDYSKIPCSIFSNTSWDLEKLTEYMGKSVEDKLFKPCELPDIIISLNKGIIFHTTCFENTIFDELLKNKVEKNYRDIFILMEFNTTEELLCMYILIMMSFFTPEPVMSDFLVRRYLKEVNITYNYKTYIGE